MCDSRQQQQKQQYRAKAERLHLFAFLIFTESQHSHSFLFQSRGSIQVGWKLGQTIFYYHFYYYYYYTFLLFIFNLTFSLVHLTVTRKWIQVSNSNVSYHASKWHFNLALLQTSIPSSRLKKHFNNVELFQNNYFANDCFNLRIYGLGEERIVIVRTLKKKFIAVPAILFILSVVKSQIYFRIIWIVSPYVTGYIMWD